MRVQNKIDIYHLVLDVLKYVKIKNTKKLEEYCNSMLLKHEEYIKEHGIDMPEVLEFKY